MKTVQVAIHDSEQAYTLRQLLLDDGGHQVHLVDRPNLAIAGVIVMEADRLERSGALGGGLERLVVMSSKAIAELASIWEAGVLHVVFHGDAPQIVRVAVLAAELSLTAPDVESRSLLPEVFQQSNWPNQCRARKALLRP